MSKEIIPTVMVYDTTPNDADIPGDVDGGIDGRLHHQRKEQPPLPRRNRPWTRKLSSVRSWAV